MGFVRSLAWRSRDGEPMQETQQQSLVAGNGFSVEPGRARRRGVTLLSLESWREACQELGTELPWHTRRANILVEGIPLASTIGSVLKIGDVMVHVHGETKPCGIMDQAHPGLRTALSSDFRGGVHGEVLTGGLVAVGDGIQIMPGPQPE